MAMSRCRSKGDSASTRVTHPRSAAGVVRHPALPTQRLAIALWYLAAILCFWPFCLHVMTNSDLWWHLAAGRWMSEHRAVVHFDPWSFTHYGGRWVDDQWLSDLSLYLWSALFGTRALVYWMWTVLLATFLLLMGLLHRLTGHVAAAFVATLLAVAMANPFFELRPHLYTLLLTVLLLWALLGRLRLPSFLLPLLFVLWSNLHGGFAFCLMALAVVLAFGGRADSADEPAGRRSWREHRLWVWTACALACLLNPYGWRILAQPLGFLLERGSSVHRITEWLPPFSEQGVSSPFYRWGIGLFLAAAAIAAFRSSISWLSKASCLALGGLTLAMSLASARFIPLFALGQSLTLALVLGDLAGTLGRWRFANQAALAHGAPLVAAGLGFLQLTAYPPPLPWIFPILTGEETFPVETCEFVTLNRLEGKVFAYFGWGGYLNLCTAGRLKVYIDSRAAMIFGEDTWNRSLKVQYEQPGWIEIVEQSGADFFLWPREATAEQMWVEQVRLDQPTALLQTGRWRIVHQDFAAVLLARSGLRLSALRETPDSPYRALTLGGDAMRSGDLEEAEKQLLHALVLDPHLLPACRNLTLVRAHRNADLAWATRARCERIFPEPQSRANLEQELSRVAGSRLAS
jgi:hypothetical protein